MSHELTNIEQINEHGNKILSFYCVTCQYSYRMIYNEESEIEYLKNNHVIIVENIEFNE